MLHLRSLEIVVFILFLVVFSNAALADAAEDELIAAIAERFYPNGDTFSYREYSDNELATRTKDAQEQMKVLIAKKTRTEAEVQLMWWLKEAQQVFWAMKVERDFARLTIDACVPADNENTKFPFSIPSSLSERIAESENSKTAQHPQN